MAVTSLGPGNDSYTKLLEAKRIAGGGSAYGKTRRARRTLPLLAGLALGCGAKEAEDPRKVLGDWTEHHGADGTEGARGKTDPTGSSPAGPAAQAALASRAECAAAARRIEELALDLAARETDDPAERAELEARRKAELASPAFRARVNQATEDCLGRETSAREARCVARARTEMDVDRCGGK